VFPVIVCFAFEKHYFGARSHDVLLLLFKPGLNKSIKKRKINENKGKKVIDNQMIVYTKETKYFGWGAGGRKFKSCHPD
jgi:hypothetical protein